MLSCTLPFRGGTFGGELKGGTARCFFLTLYQISTPLGLLGQHFHFVVLLEFIHLYIDVVVALFSFKQLSMSSQIYCPIARKSAFTHCTCVSSISLKIATSRTFHFRASFVFVSQSAVCVNSGSIEWTVRLLSIPACASF